MAEPTVVRRRRVPASANFVLMLLAFLTCVVGVLMSVGLIFTKPDDLRDLFAVGFLAAAFYTLASLI